MHAPWQEAHQVNRDDPWVIGLHSSYAQGFFPSLAHMHACSVRPSCRLAPGSASEAVYEREMALHPLSMHDPVPPATTESRV